MRDNMYENRWSPFDPKWYQQAFDKFVSTADQLFNQDLIIEQGYHIPDADGSRSSVFRNNAVLNNSFNERKLREALTDIYLNSSHKLIASNHDNTHFYQWQGYMSDMTFIPNTNLCQITLPTDTFIGPKERDKYKISQFYRKWVKVEEILNNWNVFKWHCMLFIDQKIYSDYEMRIDDHEVAIRFKYFDYWVKTNTSIYVYKFDTNAQCRIKISRELCMKQWDWKMPVSYIQDQRIANASNIIVAINKIGDPELREDGLEHVDVIGDNLEFLKIKDGFIDLSGISNFNHRYIMSESKEWLWMSIIVPKFFHEYPILLPTDVIYRPYEANFQPVVTLDHDRVQHVKTTKPNDIEYKQVYIDINNHLSDVQNGWKQMIRPIVLSDAFDNPLEEPSAGASTELGNLRDLTVKGADIIEDFRFFLMDYTTDEDFVNHLDKLEGIMNSIRNEFNAFLDKMLIETDETYERLFKKFLIVMGTIREDGAESEWLTNTIEQSDRDFWFFISPLIHIPRELADKYRVMDIINEMGDSKILWSDIGELMGKVRFQRPVDSKDFWTFEYDSVEKVWRPYQLDLTRHFPDVYVPVDPKQPTPALNRIFKAFFFYSDTMDVLHETSDIVRATPSWDNDIQEYEIEQGAVYRDIFMEKFYWMGVRAIYKELLVTKCRWEAIEYVIDNDSYSRFNELFLNTMDPYFKLGLATYLKSDNFEFPFDDAIDKLQESMDSKMFDYKKITNFEVYLNKTWIPSYFDYVTKIMDNWNYWDRLVRRPRSTFDVTRFLPILIEVQFEIAKAVKSLNEDIDWILAKLAIEDYRLNVQGFIDLKATASEMNDNISEVLEFTKGLDLQIYSIDDVNYIMEKLKKHITITDILKSQIGDILKNTEDHNVYEPKQDLLMKIVVHVKELPEHISKIAAMIQDFDMEGFMRAINDLRSYFDHAKTNPDDNSLIGYINKFDDPWSISVKEQRNQLFASTAILYGLFEPLKSYDVEEVAEFIELTDAVKNDIASLRKTISRFWDIMGYEIDQEVIDKLDHTEDFINKFVASITKYSEAREELISVFDAIREILNQFDKYHISETEIGFKDGINCAIDDMLQALSYIAGKNNKEDALLALSIINENIRGWDAYLYTEETVFTKIFELVRPPVAFIGVLDIHQELLEAMMEYMDTVNIPFVPDSTWPTYSDIYSVDSIELVSGGFKNEVGETVFVPDLGSYKIVSVSGNVARAEAIEDAGHRNTTFRDPVGQSNPYDTTTDGKGMGITVKPLSSKHIRIVNDQVIQSIIMRIQNVIYLLNNDLPNPNPSNNGNTAHTIDEIKSIDSDWNNIMSIYADYMSDDAKSLVDYLISKAMRIIPDAENFMAIREGIAVGELLEMFDNFISGYYDLFEELGMDENFYYYDEKCQSDYRNILDFFDNGSSWSDPVILKDLIKTAQYDIKLFQHKVLDDRTPSSKLETVMASANNMISRIDRIYVTINELPNTTIDINSTLRQLEVKIHDMPGEFQKDIWYKLKNVGIAKEGKNYQVGDIVEIIPELPEDKDGNPITSLEDIIMNDVILLQITEVDNGRVTAAQPLMNYAIPYLIWGIRETKTRVGNGSGLTIDAYSYEIQLSDSTLLDSSESDVSKLPMFDENDMLMFKFENIHDLDIQYEVFYGGRQITNFFQRHESDNDPLHPKNIDVLYLNANEVMDLRNSSIYIPAEHYFVYRLDKIEIIDPGAGYAVGQEIFVDVDQMALRLNIVKLTADPFKGIADAELGNGKLLHKVTNPSSDHARVATDSLNNIDDEFNVGYYDQLTQEGITKASTKSFDPEEYQFTSKRFDNLEDGDRNKVYMYPDVDMPLKDGAATNGDPDSHWYQGSRIDNSQHPMEDPRIWNGIMNLIPPTDPFIPDNRRIPTGKPVKGEYQQFGRMRFHNSNPDDALDGQTVDNDVIVKYDFSIRNAAMVEGDLVVPTFKHLPRHTLDWPNAAVGKTVIVENDETNAGHRMMYRLRTFVASGFFVYELPEVADIQWNTIEVDWRNCDFYPDYPSTKYQYPTAPWRTAKTYRAVQHEITDGKHEPRRPIQKHYGESYIHDLTVDDLSVWNWTTLAWEDLHDESRWKLEVISDAKNQHWGFKLTFMQEGVYSYDMQLYWNKIPETQMRNATLKRNAILNIVAAIAGEVNTPAINTSVNTSRHLRIRKLFPYEQKETFIIGKDKDGGPLGYEMDFKLANYLHFKNEIHLEDVKIYNKSAGRFENILDPQMFEVRFKDEKAVSRGYETQTKIVQYVIGKPGQGFVDGNAWAWNAEFGIHVFGYVTADFRTDGHLLTFTPMHCPNPPEQDIALEFQVYQHVSQSNAQAGIVMMEFNTTKLEVYGDGYIHNVNNRLAPLPKEFKVIAQYDLNEPTEYDIIISKSPKRWTFIEPEWMMAPTFHLDGYNIQQDRVYILTDRGRYPLVNPSTGKPSLQVVETANGTDVTFLNLYRRYEHLDVRTTPYPMRSVYVQRRIPANGYIDLDGKLNKPLNKKYFEFWVNGRLLYDEVTIITPTKLFLHGLRSLKNLEIIEINRDPNEYFSDIFIEIGQGNGERPIQKWNFETYLDAALEGELKGDNYTVEEQEYLLSPVWKQVEQDHPEFKNYPPNVDIEDDVLVRANPDDHITGELDDPTYQFMIIDAPTLEGHPIVERALTFEHFGFIPITESMIIDMLNEEWAKEIEENPYLPEHAVMTGAEWYGIATRLYDKYGILVNTLDESTYKVSDTNLLRINVNNRLSRIVRNPISYDLT